MVWQSCNDNCQVDVHSVDVWNLVNDKLSQAIEQNFIDGYAPTTRQINTARVSLAQLVKLCIIHCHPPRVHLVLSSDVLNLSRVCRNSISKVQIESISTATAKHAAEYMVQNTHTA